MCDVVFITPNTNGEVLDEAIGTLQLVTILEQKGIKCDVLQFFRIGDLSDFDCFLNKAVDMIEKRKPKIVSFYTRCDCYHIDLKLAEKIKESWNNIYIVFGGPQSDIVSEATIEQIPYVDFICCGEGENTIYPFFSSLLNCKPNLSVPGLVYRDNGGVRKNPRPELIENLDSLPMIDFSLFKFNKSGGKTLKSYFPLDVGRGCPFGCTYCSTKTFWGRKYRLKSAERIILEIKSIHDQFGVTHFAFEHDMFTFNRNRVIETCNLLRKLDFPIEWRCSARLDCIDKELVDIMAEAGMNRIFIGIETGSKRMQKLIKKNLKLDSAVEMVAYLKEKDIDVTTSFIYGFPEETEEDLSQTISLIAELLKIGGVNVQTHLCTFLAGTELADRFSLQMTRTNDYSDITGDFAIKECLDIIDKYPDLFSHMQEYKTPLRTKLKYFKIFFKAWKYMQPVYQYLSEKYPSDRLIEMYYDFADANREVLQRIKDMPPTEWRYLLVREDRFPKKFVDDENYDLISELYRFAVAETSDEVKKGGSVTDVYGFSPLDRDKCGSLRDIKRCITVVTCIGEEDGTVTYRIKNAL